MIPKKFITITNQDIFNEIKTQSKVQNEIKEHLIKLNGTVAKNIEKIGTNRKLLYSIGGSCMTVFIFIISVVINYHK